MGDITSANAVFTLTIPGVFSAPQQLQGFDVDSAFDVEAVDTAETKIGVDGQGSGGLIFNMVPMTVHIQADSASVLIFETWLSAQKGVLQIFPASGSIIMPSIGRKYTLSQGYLKRPQQMSSAQRVLAARPFVIDWTTINPANA